ncbi:MAG: hypothetical protein V2B19_20115 [Pseudomonadota bacterium]
MKHDQFSIADKMDCEGINPVCQNMVNLRLAGNVTPITWFKSILTNSGKPDIVAIMILSDIMYWYTPTITRDEITGEVVCLQQKFKADKLQKTYQEYADIFGFSKNQVKAAVDNLCGRKLITREFRNIKSKTGLPINNVMYLEPILENVTEISNKIRSPKKIGGHPLKKSGDTPPNFTPVTSDFMRVTPPENQGTNTDTTQTNKTTTTTSTLTAVMAFDSEILEDLLGGVPDIYRNHRDVIKSLKAFSNTHGIDYVKTELKYAAKNSTKIDGFPVFLKRALENGWGTSTLQVNKTLDEQKKFERDRRIQKQMEIEKQIKEKQAQLAEKQRELDKNVQAKLASLSADELNKIKELARQEAMRQVPRPKGLHSDLAALAKKTLADLPGTEQDRIRREAENSVRKILRNALSDDNAGFIHAVENRMVGIVRENFSLTSPLSIEFERRVAEKTELMIPKIVCREYDLSIYGRNC